MSRPDRLTSEQIDSLQPYLKGQIEPPNDMCRHLIRRFNEVSGEIERTANIESRMMSEGKKLEASIMAVRERLSEQRGLGGGYLLDLWELLGLSERVEIDETEDGMGSPSKSQVIIPKL